MGRPAGGARCSITLPSSCRAAVGPCCLNLLGVQKTCGPRCLALCRYFHTLPFLLLRTQVPPALALPALLIIEVRLGIFCRGCYGRIFQKIQRAG